MQKLSQIAAALVMLMYLSASVVQAETATDSAATDSAAPTPPNTASDKAAAPSPAPLTAPAATSPAETKTTATDPVPAARKKKPARMTRRQEIDRSIDSGTVPARYRSSVPKEYQHYIPFAK